MISFTCFILICFPVLSYSAPLYSNKVHDDDQALFTAASASAWPNEDDMMGTSSRAPTSTSISPSSSLSAHAQDASVTTAPSPTTVFFAPDGSSTPTPSSDDKKRPSHPLVAAYYPDWTASQLSPEKVDFDRLDCVDFAFAVPDPVTFTPKFLEDDSEDLLNRLVASAHAKNKLVKLSIGGWTGSGHFSDAVNEKNRNSFAQDIVTLYHKFSLDGVDIDWEYPGEAGAAGNVYTPVDSANFLAFLQLLRSLLPKKALLTAATQVWPFVDADGIHLKDISPFAQVLDWVLLMNYDVWGSSPNPGPNAPLSDECHNSTQPEANAHAAISTWTAAGFPAQQIMLGLPAYGYISKSDAATLRTRRRSTPATVPFERTPSSAVASNNGENNLTAPAPEKSLTVASEDGSTQSGQVQFNALVAQGALIKNAPGSSPSFAGTGGFERIWDVCSGTPFLRSAGAGQIITYDDPESLGIKAAFAKEAGILGVNMWDAHGDTQQWDLIDGIRRGLGLP